MSAILVFGEGLVSGGANVPQSLGYVDLVRGQQLCSLEFLCVRIIPVSAAKITAY